MTIVANLLEKVYCLHFKKKRMPQMSLLLHIRGILRKQNKQTMLPWLEGRRSASQRRGKFLFRLNRSLFIWVSLVSLFHGAHGAGHGHVPYKTIRVNGAFLWRIYIPAYDQGIGLSLTSGNTSHKVNSIHGP